MVNSPTSTPVPDAHTRTSFGALLRADAARFPVRDVAARECRTSQGTRCELCQASRIDYELEYTLKAKALREFWSAHHLPSDTLADLVRSPLGRRYRSVSKRKVFFHKPNYTLGLLGLDEARSNTFGIEISQCMIEPQEHEAVYAAVSAYIAKNEHRDLAGLLTYVIVKGSTREFTVIVNTSSYAPKQKQMFTAFSKYLTKHVPSITAVFVFVDAERSKYYLSGNAQLQKKRQLVLHKLFGASQIFHAVGQKKFLYSPLSFSQTNHSILDAFTSKAGALLGLTKKDHLYDLYCGYGLFSLCLADQAASVTGVELSRDSIEDAKANAARQRQSQTRFIASDISEEDLPRFMKHHGETLKVLLDPPRNGTKPGVIEQIAEYAPSRVCHIFCNIEMLPLELKRWNDAGYRMGEAVPFDMFPGTEELELMIGLEPA
ncbi:MAG TPA: methyltransferase domain-containing protein [Bacteroidota bacterium]|nr:methyltransferase domain-containing protein [Bacteroidota bacterium]